MEKYLILVMFYLLTTQHVYCWENDDLKGLSEDQKFQKNASSTQKQENKNECCKTKAANLNQDTVQTRPNLEAILLTESVNTKSGKPPSELHPTAKATKPENQQKNKNDEGIESEVEDEPSKINVANSNIQTQLPTEGNQGDESTVTPTQPNTETTRIESAKSEETQPELQSKTKNDTETEMDNSVPGDKEKEHRIKSRKLQEPKDEKSGTRNEAALEENSKVVQNREDRANQIQPNLTTNKSVDTKSEKPQSTLKTPIKIEDHHKKKNDQTEAKTSGMGTMNIILICALVGLVIVLGTFLTRYLVKRRNGQVDICRC